MPFRGEQSDIYVTMRLVLLLFGFALCFPVLSVWAQGPSLVPPFQNVKVGEAPGVSRVIVICGRQCAGDKQRDGRYYLAGISGALDIDMTASGKFVSGLSIENLGNAARLTVSTADAPIRSEIAACGSTTICIDLYHPAEPLFDQVVPASTSRGQEISDTLVPATVPNETGRERMPQPAAVPVSPSRQVKRLGNRTVSTGEEGGDETIACTSYYHQLQQDAWDMVAYKKTALCAASAGDIARARALFERYLMAFPNDEEALAAFASMAPEVSARSGSDAAGGSGMRYGF
ncbi:MAG: hypothetical protein MRY72_03320 [Aquisalinus sp.]|nr:hypothetical protein [Aquisalinus sp.]